MTLTTVKVVFYVAICIFGAKYTKHKYIGHRLVHSTADWFQCHTVYTEQQMTQVFVALKHKVGHLRQISDMDSQFLAILAAQRSTEKNGPIMRAVFSCFWLKIG